MTSTGLPATRPSRPASGPTGLAPALTLGSAGLPGWCALGAALTVSLQVKLGAGFLKPTMAVSDIFIVLGIAALGLRGLSLPRQRGVGVLALALALSIVFNGTLSFYAYGQKLGGLFLLAGHALLVERVESLRSSFSRLVLRTFVVGVVAHTSVALLLWQVEQSGGTPVLEANPFHPRLSGLIEDPNAFGGLTASALVVSIVLVAQARRRPARDAAWVFCIGILGTGTLLSYSRSAWIGLALGLLAAGWLLRLRQLRTVFVVVLGAFALLSLVAPDLIELDSRLAARETSINSRADALELGLDAFSESPAFGIGIGESGQRFGVIPHNTTLWLLIETGVLGVIGFGLILWRPLTALRPRTAKHLQSSAAGALAGIVTMIGLSMGIEALYQRQWWILLGVFAATSRRSARALGPRGR